MNFIWITPTYRVNVSSIFSLQRESKVENPEYIVWKTNYDEYMKTIQRELPPMEVDGELFDPKDEETVSEEKLDKYAQILKEKLVESLGKEPPEFIYKYAIVTHTGMKIYVSEDKYEKINKIIDDIQKEKGE